MPAYHSSFNEEPDVRQIGNMSILPIKTKYRGRIHLKPDIIDETLDLFRANSLFRNFEIKGPADRTLIVLILFISDCLAKIGSARATPNKIEATKSLNTLSVDNFPIPGDANFALNAHYAAAASRADSDFLRSYLTQVRQELSLRLVAILYGDGDVPSKWWMSFQKRRFMNRSLGRMKV
ncbi:ARP2/3 complex, 21 kDa p21-Arc subunit [Gymnopus androsaceus JB14]|uniref:Actin-related protein 2/3 complex subunit 3 n=1 Tax=Gymnopus androsaceus JB14 TaxID=1447944 RepID=A0A6A4ICT3_9AGAR|nr:ARP2/3 complex, 21 kDa p21-Arc subunit [Gymnopus androsaceus JB14]